jgi:hypothetical protein
MRRRINLLHGGFTVWIGIFATTFLSTSCVEESLQQRTDTKVHIIYDWGDNMPQPTTGMQLFLYPANGDTPLTFATPNEGYEGKLPSGHFQLLAYNEQAAGMQIAASRAANVAGYADARVRAVTRLEGHRSFVEPEGPVYAVNDDNLEVSLRPGVQEIHYRVRPLNVNIPIVINNHTGHSLTSVTGTLEGVVLSRTLSNGDGNFGEGYGCARFTANFGKNDAQATTNLMCMGFYNPDPDGDGRYRYQSMLQLQVTYSDGTVIPLSKDISAQLVQQMQRDDLSFNIELEISLENDSTDFTIRVSDWNDGGSMDWSTW